MLPLRKPAPGGDEAEVEALLRRLFPICRSITGNGVRDTLAILRQVADFATAEVASGTACLDWVVPDEWNIRDAYVADLNGRRLIDFRAHNLHVVSYSEPIDAVLTFDELAPHLHSLADQPDAIPYRTSYYKRAWGFCLPHRQLQGFDRAAKYRVKIDSTLASGSLTYGARTLSGTSGREYLVSTYCCHPSLANDNLSGMVLWALLLRALAQRTLRHTYRFVIAPETIGSVVYLAQDSEAMRACAGGFVLSTVGGPGRLGFKRSFRGDSTMDVATRQMFRELGLDFLEYPFDVLGSDERNYSSPGFRIPAVTICKDKYYEYPQYHTSLDDLAFVRPGAILESLGAYLHAIEVLESDRTYKSLLPDGEPQLGKRGLYPQVVGGAINATPTAEAIAGFVSTKDAVAALLNVAFWADGKTSLLQIAQRTDLSVRVLADAAAKLATAGVIREVPDDA